MECKINSCTRRSSSKSAIRKLSCSRQKKHCIMQTVYDRLCNIQLRCTVVSTTKPTWQEPCLVLRICPMKKRTCGEPRSIYLSSERGCGSSVQPVCSSVISQTWFHNMVHCLLNLAAQWPSSSTYGGWQHWGTLARAEPVHHRPGASRKIETRMPNGWVMRHQRLVDHICQPPDFIPPVVDVGCGRILPDWLTGGETTYGL